MSATLALDVGATKIAWGIIADNQPRSIVAHGRVPTQPQGSTAQEQIKKAIAEVLATGHAFSRVGMGAPGVIESPRGIVRYNGKTIQNWIGTDLRALVHELVDIPVAAANDVRTWGYGEHQLGAHCGARNSDGRVLYISVGTGVGGAIVENGRLLDGPTGSAGEVSELVAADFRGFADRVENIASGASLARYYEVLSKNPDQQQIPWSDPAVQKITLSDMVASDDPLAHEIIRGNLYGLGRTLGAMVSAWDVAAVVLGGGVVALGDIVLDPIVAGVRENALPINQDIPITTSALPDPAPLIAAACFGRDFAE